MTATNHAVVSRVDLAEWLLPYCYPDRVSIMYPKANGDGPGWTNSAADSERAIDAWRSGNLLAEVFESTTENGNTYRIRGGKRLGVVLHRAGLVRRICLDLDAHEGGVDNTHLADKLDAFLGATAVRFTSKSGKGLHLFYALADAVPVADFVAWAKAWRFNSAGQPECFPKTAKLSQVWLPNEPNEKGGDAHVGGDFDSCVVNQLPPLPPPPPKEPKPTSRLVNGQNEDDKPGTAFSRSDTPWADILNGAVCVREFDGKEHWRRPGKSGGNISATTGVCKSADGAREYLYVFTNAWSPFEQNECYDKFSAYALLHHNGDFKAAARKLRADGFGKQSASGRNGQCNRGVELRGELNQHTRAAGTATKSDATMPTSGEQQPPEAAEPDHGDAFEGEDQFAEVVPAPGKPPSDFPFAEGEPQKSTDVAAIEPTPITQLVRLNTNREYLLDKFILRNTTTLLSGYWKAGKTTFFSWLILSLIKGDTFLGLTCRPSKVLIVTEEDADIWCDRRDALGLTDQVGVIVNPFLSKPTLGVWREFIKRLVVIVKRDGYDIVFMDTIFTLWCVNDENDAGEVTAAMLPIRELKEQAAVFFGAHLNKADSTQGRGTRGSGALPSSVDTILELRRKSDNIEDTRRELAALGRYSPPPVTLID
ncbi:MAG: AAA family ATPase, partial [Planctomycetota bacterium]